MDGDLHAILKHYPAIAQPLGEPVHLGSAGGLSGSRLWRYQAGAGELLARAWPIDGPPQATLQRIHGWLRDAGDLGFLPVPFCGRDGRTLYERAGRLWEVAPWMRGAAETRRPASPEHVPAAFSALAAFHQRLSRYQTAAPSPGIRARLDELRAWLSGGIELVETKFSGCDDPTSALAGEWLAFARERAPGLVDSLRRVADLAVPLQPCLRDVRPEHFLFTGESVTGLIDFGAMAVETVAGDLARLSCEWSLDEPASRAAALRAYAAVRPIAMEETVLIDAFTTSSPLLAGGHWVRWHFLEGRVFDDSDAVVHGLQRSVASLRAGGSTGLVVPGSRVRSGLGMDSEPQRDTRR
jgi:homoserine kinase type II